MAFIERFLSLTFVRSLTAQNRYDKVRLKIPKHPLEPDTHLGARVLISVLADRATPLPIKPVDPDSDSCDLCDESSTGQVIEWIEIGAAGRRKLERALKKYPSARFTVYFLQQDEIAEFCHELRGSVKNWIEAVHFFLLDATALEQWSEALLEYSEFELVQSDSTAYLTYAEQTIAIELQPVDIWNEYQRTIHNVAS